MNTAEYVDKKIAEMKMSGIPLSDAAWEAALLCVGWPYVFGARGQYCTPAHRRARYNATKPGKNKDNIKNRCKNFEGSGTCSGCKWYPNCKRTRDFDCRGFTYWILLQVFGWTLKGAGATSQWNTASNWKAKGLISDGIPENTLVCLFQANGKTMEHTGLGLNNETIECSNGVQHFTTRSKKWSHWGVPACVSGDIPTPIPPDKRPTLRRGSKGEYVVECQTDLVKLKYDIGSSGIDGVYGKATMAAVSAFQKDHGLTADGICGPDTWAALDKAIADLDPSPAKTYTVTIHRLEKEEAERLAADYPGKSEILEES